MSRHTRRSIDWCRSKNKLLCNSFNVRTWICSSSMNAWCTLIRIYRTIPTDFWKWSYTLIATGELTVCKHLHLFDRLGVFFFNHDLNRTSETLIWHLFCAVTNTEIRRHTLHRTEHTRTCDEGTFSTFAILKTFLAFKKRVIRCLDYKEPFGLEQTSGTWCSSICRIYLSPFRG